MLSAAGPPRAGSLRGQLPAGLGQTQSQEFALELGWLHLFLSPESWVQLGKSQSRVVLRAQMHLWVVTNRWGMGEETRQVSLPLLQGPKDDSLGGCTLGTF